MVNNDNINQSPIADFSCLNRLLVGDPASNRTKSGYLVTQSGWNYSILLERGKPQRTTDS